MSDGEKAALKLNTFLAGVATKDGGDMQRTFHVVCNEVAEIKRQLAAAQEQVRGLREALEVYEQRDDILCASLILIRDGMANDPRQEAIDALFNAPDIPRWDAVLSPPAPKTGGG